ncbi:hypothetical protein GGS24DRAFT_396606 [Hypoxylon argillaceum]|nr:hypothetical protein GGS24DRAFT_396606 [Hypoxylon argillaceum]
MSSRFLPPRRRRTLTPYPLAPPPVAVAAAATPLAQLLVPLVALPAASPAPAAQPRRPHRLLPPSFPYQPGQVCSASSLLLPCYEAADQNGAWMASKQPGDLHVLYPIRPCPMLGHTDHVPRRGLASCPRVRFWGCNEEGELGSRKTQQFFDCI